MIGHGGDDALHRQAELFGGRLKDADIGLVRHQPIDGGGLDVALFCQQRLQGTHPEVHIVQMAVVLMGRVVSRVVRGHGGRV